MIRDKKNRGQKFCDKKSFLRKILQQDLLSASKAFRAYLESLAEATKSIHMSVCHFGDDNAPQMLFSIDLSTYSEICPCCKYACRYALPIYHLSAVKDFPRRISTDVKKGFPVAIKKFARFNC